MTITIAGFDFQGPYRGTGNLTRRMGVYVVYKKGPEEDIRYFRKYIGYSESIRERVDDLSHHKRDCWMRETNNDPYFAVRYISNQQQARDVETRIINDKATPCNDT